MLKSSTSLKVELWTPDVLQSFLRTYSSWTWSASIKVRCRSRGLVLKRLFLFSHWEISCGTLVMPTQSSQLNLPTSVTWFHYWIPHFRGETATYLLLQRKFKFCLTFWKTLLSDSPHLKWQGSLMRFDPRDGHFGILDPFLWIPLEMALLCPHLWNPSFWKFRSTSL